MQKMYKKCIMKLKTARKRHSFLSFLKFYYFKKINWFNFNKFQRTYKIFNIDQGKKLKILHIWIKFEYLSLYWHLFRALPLNIKQKIQ